MVEEIVKDEFKNNYASYTVHKQSDGARSSKKKVCYCFCNIYPFADLLQHTVNSSDSEGSLSKDSSDSNSDDEGFMNKLECYLSTGQIKDITDPLKWWHDN